MATWAPKENTIECVEYLKMLKDNILV